MRPNNPDPWHLNRQGLDFICEVLFNDYIAEAHRQGWDAVKLADYCKDRWNPCHQYGMVMTSIHQRPYFHRAEDLLACQSSEALRAFLETEIAIRNVQDAEQANQA